MKHFPEKENKILELLMHLCMHDILISAYKIIFPPLKTYSNFVTFKEAENGNNMFKILAC